MSSTEQAIAELKREVLLLSIEMEKEVKKVI